MTHYGQSTAGVWEDITTPSVKLRDKFPGQDVVGHWQEMGVINQEFPVVLLVNGCTAKPYSFVSATTPTTSDMSSMSLTSLASSTVLADFSCVSFQDK